MPVETLLPLLGSATAVALLASLSAIPLAALLLRNRTAPLLWGLLLLPLLVPPSASALPLAPLREAIDALSLPWFPGAAAVALLLSLPFAVIPLFMAFRRVDPQLIEAAETLGASPGVRTRALLLPASRGALLGGFLLSAIHAGWLLLLLAGPLEPGLPAVAAMLVSYGALALVAAAGWARR